MNQNDPQKSYEQQACDYIDAEIETIRCDMHLLMDFYSGVKTLSKPNKPSTEENDKRLFWTLGQLRERIKDLQKQRARLMKDLSRNSL
jgi:hypothetical protein